MAVYKRSYRPYGGGYTPQWSRFLILTRYAMKGIFKSRFVTGLYVVSFFYPIVVIALMYLNHNSQVLSLMKLDRGHLFDIGGNFFMLLMGVQMWMAFLTTAFIGPNMIAPDLANGGLPLYFCRPLSRTKYVLGRALAIFFLLSLMTWVPGLIVFGVETSLSGLSWGWQHINYAVGVVLGSLLWITVLAMLALALSAWVRWKLIAGALILAIMFMMSGFAAAINGVLRTKVGFYLDPTSLVGAIFANMFGVQLNTGISVPGAVIALLLICSFFVFLLQKKVRAFEVVK
jgi:ABC-2 type transport system permease protein